MSPEGGALATETTVGEGGNDRTERLAPRVGSYTESGMDDQSLLDRAA